MSGNVCLGVIFPGKKTIKAKVELIHELKVLGTIYLTIRLRARDFYAVIVDESKARINYHRIEIESE